MKRTIPFKNQSTGVWVGIVSIIMIAALVLWWIAGHRPLDFSIGQPNGVTGTASSTGNSSTKSQTTTKKSPVTISRVSRKTQDVATIVRSLAGTSQFNALFKSTGVSATINPKSVTKYTIFVPTNGAFAQMPPGMIGNMTSAEKKRFVQYHVVSGRAVDVDAQTSGTIQALSGDMLNFNYGTDKIPLVNSAIVITAYEGKNGIVYLIDNVLLPPKKSQ